MCCQCRTTKEHHYLDAKHSQNNGSTQFSNTVCNMTLCLRGQKPILSILQHGGQLAPLGLLESTQAKSCSHSAETHHASPLFILFYFFLPSWLSVLPMLYTDYCSCLYDCSSCSWQQSTENGVGPTCEWGEAQFDERSATGGAEERSAATRRHLAQESAAPRDQCHPISSSQSL